MFNKKNDYVVVRRIDMINDIDDWEEFESTVRAYVNRGYELVGGVSITSVNNDLNGRITVAQALIGNKTNA